MSHSYAIVSALYLPHAGGVENYTYCLSEELIRLGNCVTVITSRLSEDDPEIEVQDNGVKVVRMPSHILLGGRLPLVKRNVRYKRLFSRLLEEGFDRVLVNTRFYSLSIEGLKLATRGRAKAMVLDHGSAYLTLGNPFADACIRLYEHAVTKEVKSFNPLFAGVSKKSCEWLKSFGIQTSTIISNAIDAQAFRDGSSGRDFRNELMIGEGQKVVSFIGRLAPEKGAEQLAEAALLLGDGYQVLFAGDGPLRQTIEYKGIPNLTLLGGITRSDVSALLSQSDVLCLPTRSEGFCTALLEASAWGVPFVMPNVGGVEEVRASAPWSAFILENTAPTTIADQIIKASERGRGLPCDAEYSWSKTALALERAFEVVT